MNGLDGLCMGCMNEKGEETICPICGYNDTEQNSKDSLPIKFVIDERYVIGKIVSSNGEALAYISWDNYREVPVIVEEYFPKDFCVRNPDMTVSVIKGSEYVFNGGLLEFGEINRNIMESELSALISVKAVFEDNGTIYAVSDYIPGITLEDFLKKNGGVLKWEQARALCLPLIDTIKGMNDIGIIHGGISPETVVIGRDGKLRITNYTTTALRRAESEFECELYDGFAAVEQYGGEGFHNDTYTDVYGLAATIFRVLIGTVPPEATKRLSSSNLTIPAKFAEEMPRHVLGALANALQVLPKNRTKDVESFKNELVYGEMPTQTPVKKAAAPAAKKQEAAPKKSKSSAAKYVVLSAICTATIFAIIAGVMYYMFLKPGVQDDTSSTSNVSSEIFTPEVNQIGDVESGAEVTAKLFEMPDFSDKYYSSIGDIDIAGEKCSELFEIVIVDKEYSDKIAKGKITSQSVKAGSMVERDTKIELVISLGTKEIKMPNLVGMTEEEAKFELLKHGFIFENINPDKNADYTKYDDKADPGVVVEQSPAFGESVNTDIAVIFYINSYIEEDFSSAESGTTSRVKK